MTRRTLTKPLAALLLVAMLIACIPGTLLAYPQAEAAEAQETQLTQPNPAYPEVVPTNLNIVAIDGQYLHHLGLDDEGNVWAWGYNSNEGQIGNGQAKIEYVPLTQIELPGKAVQIACGRIFSMALLEDGTVYQWGKIGPTPYKRFTPERVAELSDIITIEATGYSAIAIAADGKVYSWGFSNSNGVLGLQGGARATPTLIDLKDVQSINSCDITSVAILHDGTVKAWGGNLWDYLLVGSEGQYDSIYVPTESRMADYKFTYINQNYSSYFGITGNGELMAWGNNEYSQLGIGHLTNVVQTPTKVAMDGVAQAIPGSFGSAVLRNDGTVWTSGYNIFGILGQGEENQQYQISEFTQIEGFTDVVSISGSNHVVYMQTSDGSWWGWGNASYGLPHSTNYNFLSDPVLIFASDSYVDPTDPVDPPDPEDTHNVTVIVTYDDAAHPDEVTTYNVPAGAEFLEGYTVQPGYKYGGFMMYSLLYAVDPVDQTVYISEVNQDITVELQYERSEYNVTVTVQYEDDALPRDTQTYSVKAGQGFEGTFEILDGYTLGRVETSTLGVGVNGSKKTITIRAVNGEVFVTINLIKDE